MQREEPLEPPLFGPGWSNGLRWLASLGGAAFTAFCVLNATAGADQRIAWLMERARPACAHGSMGNEELHRVAQHELMASNSKQDALRAIVTLCQTKFQDGQIVGSPEDEPSREAAR
jgi:hypothetical protein